MPPPSGGGDNFPLSINGSASSTRRHFPFTTRPLITVPPRRPALLLIAATLAFTPARAALDAPVSPRALPEVGWVLQLLADTSAAGKIISGQQEQVDWFGLDNEKNFDFVRTATGRTPAIRGFDFMFYTHSAAGRSGQRVSERALVWARRGGLVQLCAHWFVDTGSPAGSPKFYTKETTFDLRRALLDGTPENAEFLRELDLMAEELKKLRDARVPVIWRPFHECSGGWFWWGAQGAAPFVQAYRFMFDRYTRVHGLTNLIWCYNPTETPGALERWYPGDDVVDLIGLDIYPAAGTHPAYAAQYRQFRDFRAGRKPVALTENGAIPDLDAMAATGAAWASFCTWNGFESDAAQNPPDFLRRVYADPRVITLETMPDVYRRLSVPPAIAVTPAATTVGRGADVTLAVSATGTAPHTYQWRKDGADLSGATAATLTFANVSAADAAGYSVTVRNAFGSVASAPAALTVAPAPFLAPSSTLANLSTRGRLLTHGDVLIAGFVVGGAGAKNLLIRAVGPALSAFGVAGALADPVLTLVAGDGTLVAENDDWSGPFPAVGAFPLPPGGKDAALLVSLPPGAYTALVRSADAVSGGVALIEIYDAAPATASRLLNLSTRGTASAADPLITGFVIAGSSSRDLLLRAAGPALAAFGVPGALARPQLALTTPAGTILSANSAWSADPAEAPRLAAAFAQTGAFPFAAGSADAALLVRRPPGAATAITSGGGDTRGTVLVEIYETPAAP